MRLSSMLNHRITAVIENEWAQLTRSKIIIFTILVPPFLLIAVALMLLFLSSMIDTSSMVPGPEVSGLLAGYNIGPSLSKADAFRASLLSPFVVLFQVIPLVVPITIASHTIVAEKQSRSLEALLATPIRTWELLLGKALAASLPGILVSWYSFSIFAGTARFVVSDTLYKRLVVGPTWMLTITILTPLLTFLAVGLGIIISSKVRDAHSAQQLGSLVILPLIGTLVAQLTGAVNINVGLVLLLAATISLVDLVLLVAAVRLFRREAILTTWR